MEPRSQPAVAGPVIFFGLIIYTMFAPEVDLTTYANPADVMDVGAISVPQAALFAVRPFSEFAPARRPVLAPARFEQSALPKQASADGTEMATTPSQSPSRFYSSEKAFEIAAPPSPVTEVNTDPIKAVSDNAATGLRPSALFTPMTSARYTPEIHQWVQVTGIAVNLRADPDLSAEVIAQFDTGARALKVAEQGIWSELTFLNDTPVKSGWMATKFLSVQPTRYNPPALP